jgi:hypothetical protein
MADGIGWRGLHGQILAADGFSRPSTFSIVRQARFQPLTIVWTDRHWDVYRRGRLRDDAGEAPNSVACITLMSRWG